jgi:hypothetical protein
MSRREFPVDYVLSFGYNYRMTTKRLQQVKEVTRQLGCRANERDEILITKAAELDKRNRNNFIITAATEVARRIVQEAGIDEESLYPKRGSRRAA